MEETHALATAMFMLWYACTDLPSLVDYRAFRCLWNCGLKDLTYCHAGAEEHHLWGHLRELVLHLSQRNLKPSQITLRSQVWLLRPRSALTLCVVTF